MSKTAVKGKELPEGWREAKLGEVSIFSKGNGITKNELVENGVPCVRYGELYTRHNFRVLNFYSFISDKNLTKYKLIKKNDLLFAGSGETREEIGKSASFDYKIKAYAGGDVIICSIDSKNLRADFASYYLNTIGRKQLNKLGQGDSIVHIYSRVLEGIEISFPSLPEQEAITTFLEKWDTAIEKTEALITAKEQQFKWLLKTLISDQQNNPEWQKVVLGDVFRLGRGRVISKKEIQDNQGSFPVYSSQTSNNGELGRISTYDLEGDYITWTTDGANAGTVFYRTGKFNCTNVCGTGKPINQDEVNCQFASYFLQNKTKKHVSYVGNPKLMNNVFSKIPIALAPSSQQKQISKTLNTAKYEINLLEILAKKYRTQKRGLMQKLLTGEWRVTGYSDECKSLENYHNQQTFTSEAINQ